ncbi:MAG: YdcF family protein [Atopobiaceae bacterium]|nr:YdcF family protein [Atopobiaceae bacterium]
MKREKSTLPVPIEGIGRRFLVLIPLLAVLVLASYVYIKPRLGTYQAAWYLPYGTTEPVSNEVVLSDPGVVEVLAVEQPNSGRAYITFRALADGQTKATASAGKIKRTFRLEVKNGGIFEGGVNFSGWEVIGVSLCIFLGALTALFASVLKQLWQKSWYGYEMVASGGALLFCLFQFLLFTGICLFGRNPNFYNLLIDVSYMADYFALASLFLMAPMALLVSISNISLITHEGRRPVNLLGVAVSVVWIFFFVAWYALDSMLYGMERPVVKCLNAMAGVSITFGECLLLSTILCAWLASRHVPNHAVDYLVVLGCGIRQDGTPSPLLASRVDRAVTFDEQRIALGNAPATYVPSGGKGPDEPMSEAQSMANYLVAQKGVAPERIALEGRSVNTRQNMAFSREVIEQHAGRDVSQLQVGFSTTNYHVFRGYVCAHQAGMAVEGMGSKTKYYFWPNAFLREFAGLLVTEWKNILRLYLVIAFIYVTAVYILSVI